MTPTIEKHFQKLQEYVNREMEYSKQLMEIEGMLHILLATTTTGAQKSIASSERNSITKAMIPSAAASANANVVYSVV